MFQVQVKNSKQEVIVYAADFDQEELETYFLMWVDGEWVWRGASDYEAIP